MATMYTTGQAAHHLGVSPNTLRISWCKEFSDYLSDTAVPPPGKERKFTEEDIKVLQTVAILRDQQKGYGEIRQELEQGIRLEPAESDKTRQDTLEPPKNAPGMALETVQAFSTAMQAYETRLDKLEARLEATQERLIDAEKRATAAETEVRILREQQSQERPATDEEGKEKEKRPGWWDRLRGKG